MSLLHFSTVYLCTRFGGFRFDGERYTVYDKELKEVKRKLANLKYELEHGLFAKQENITVSGWFDIWIKFYG